MSNYDKLAKFYDDVIGNYSEYYSLLIKLITKYKSDSNKILELGCGTGGILKQLSKNFSVSGIDLSEEMLNEARNKLPFSSFYNMDISDFRIDDKFDVIFCVYDTINHLTNFTSWMKLFANVKHHLKDKGIFIFDFNTLYKLNSLASDPPFILRFNDNYMIMNVTSKSKNLFDWNITIFESLNEKEYLKHDEIIAEASFEYQKIKSEIKKSFKLLKVFDNDRKLIGKSSDRIFIVCQKN